MDSDMHCVGWELSGVALGLVLCASGCAYFAEQPEVYPDKFAPAASDRAWIPKSTAAHEYVIPMQSRPPSSLPEPPVTRVGNQYDLPALIDVALSNNPDTRRTWMQARAAAASYGASRAPYYPVVDTQLSSAYSRRIFELPGQNGALKQWRVTPPVGVPHTLLPFRPPD